MNAKYHITAQIRGVRLTQKAGGRGLTSYTVNIILSVFVKQIYFCQSFQVLGIDQLSD